MHNRPYKEGGIELIIMQSDCVIEAFMKEFAEGGYLAYERLSERARQIVADELGKLEIEHHIFVREKEGSASAGAKSPASVRRSITRRQSDRGKEYETAQEILFDMHDLAGIRIALYQPNDIERVAGILQDRFVNVKPRRDWPDPDFGPFPYPNLDVAASRKQSLFHGYCCRHYYVQLRESYVTEPAIKGKTVEIQLMTIWMQGWSKFHYDLVYKPKPGIPPADENDERLLDASNGLIMAGEQILRQIQINSDQKRELGKRPLRGEDEIWSYLEEKGVYVGADALLYKFLGPPSLLRSERKRILYESLHRLEFETPQILDKLVEHGLRRYGSGPEGTKSAAPTLCSEIHGGIPVDMIIISAVDQDDFKAREAKALQIPRRDSWSLERSKEVRLVRYMAMIICNSLRLFDLGSLGAVWEGRGDFPSPYPSGQEFLKVLHPGNTLEGDDPVIRDRLHRLCSYLLDWEDPAWKLRCALSRLGYFKGNTLPYDTGASGIPDQEFVIATCPLGFIRLLDHSNESGDTLENSFMLKKNAEKNGVTRLGYDHNYPYLQGATRKLACPSAMTIPMPMTNGRDGIWNTTVDERSGNIIHLDFPAVRDYLDRPSSMGTDQRGAKEV